MMALPGRRCGLRGNLIGKRYSMCPRSTNHNSASEVDEPYELCSSTRLTEVGRRGGEPHETHILIGREVGTIVCTINRKEYVNTMGTYTSEPFTWESSRGEGCQHSATRSPRASALTGKDTVNLVRWSAVACLT